MKPYIGITGFTKSEEVTVALDVFPKNSKRKLMVGVLATYKSLRGIPMKPKWARQTPKCETIRDIFLNDERAINLVHFSTEEGQEKSVLADMIRVHELGGPNLHGFQLNLAWPKRQLDDYRMIVGCKPRVVLQIGQKAVEMAGGTPQGVVDMLYHYLDSINDVLFDPSGGLGKPFDIERACEFLSAIAEQGWDIGLGVAGGLGPDSLNLVKPLLTKFPELSIDAQGRLRNIENNLDMEAVKAYLAKASQMFSG